jgi:hypothetical protein
MVEYLYTRELIDGCWNVENIDRKDEEGNHIFLGQEIQIALPGKMFNFILDGAEIKFVFEEELSEAEQSILGTVVYNHKNNL